MNFLAHFYLSGDSEPLVIGNFLGDMVRKVEWKNYSPAIVEGIKMHQHIDFFTDNHPIVKSNKALLTQKHKHFSGVILDIYYDYFLAKNWGNYHELDLPEYADWVYQSLGKQEINYSKKAKMAFGHMKKHNWLTAYSSLEGIDQVLKGMAQRTRFDSEMGTALFDLQQHQSVLQDGFQTFLKI
jgi:acyl carrier protein phosphodiesterase